MSKAQTILNKITKLHNNKIKEFKKLRYSEKIKIEENQAGEPVLNLHGCIYGLEGALDVAEWLNDMLGDKALYLTAECELCGKELLVPQLSFDKKLLNARMKVTPCKCKETK
jgi:hypothetical protein